MSSGEVDGAPGKNEGAFLRGPSPHPGHLEANQMGKEYVMQIDAFIERRRMRACRELLAPKAQESIQPTTSHPVPPQCFLQARATKPGGDVHGMGDGPEVWFRSRARGMSRSMATTHHNMSPLQLAVDDTATPALSVQLRQRYLFTDYTLIRRPGVAALKGSWCLAAGYK